MVGVALSLLGRWTLDNEFLPYANGLRHVRLRNISTAVNKTV